jgi:hypothetical protein
LVALFHDIGKEDTIVKAADGTTRCPDHAAVSAYRFDGLGCQFDLVHAERQYVHEIIARHHCADSIFEATDSRDRTMKEFLVRNSDYTVDLLIFYVADFEGCDASSEVRQLKREHYSLVLDKIKRNLTT